MPWIKIDASEPSDSGIGKQDLIGRVAAGDKEAIAIFMSDLQDEYCHVHREVAPRHEKQREDYD